MTGDEMWVMTRVTMPDDTTKPVTVHRDVQNALDLTLAGYRPAVTQVSRSQPESDLMTMTRAARDLTEPGEPNAEGSEYIRGQVNLITDVCGLAGNDAVYELLTATIAHHLTLGAGVDAIEAIRRTWPE
jgi:hypothetical protein